MNTAAQITQAADLMAEFDAGAARIFRTQPFHRATIAKAFRSGFRAQRRCLQSRGRYREARPTRPEGLNVARVTKSVAKLERLMTALDAYNRLDIGDDGSVEWAERCIRAQNVLLDACIDCGMPLDGDEFAFAARACTRFLCAA